MAGSEMLKTNSKSFNATVGGFPRGAISMVYLGGANTDLFRLAFVRLFTHPVNYSVKVYDFFKDYVSEAAACYKIPSSRMDVKTDLRYQSLMPSLVQDIRGPNPPDVVIINDMDALIRTNPNDYRRLAAITMNTRVALIFLAPVVTQRDPRRIRFVKVLKRLEIALPLVIEAGMGEIVEDDYTFTLKVLRNKALAVDANRHIAITLPFQELAPEQRSRKRIIPSQVVSKGKFTDRGVLARLAAQGGGMETSSAEEGESELPMAKPGELRTREKEKPRAPVAGAVNLSENLQEMAAQIEQQPQEERVEVASGPIEDDQPDSSQQQNKDTDAAQLPDEQIPDDAAPELQELEFEEEAEKGFACIVCKKEYHESFKSVKVPAAICKYCTNEMPRPDAPLTPKKLTPPKPPAAATTATTYCKHCGSNETYPISAEQQTADGFKSMIRCKTCKKTFMLTRLFEESPMTDPAGTGDGEDSPDDPQVAEAAQRIVRGMRVEGDSGTPVMNQQPMAKPGQGISANATRPKLSPTTPQQQPSRVIPVEADQQEVRVAHGMRIENGDNEVDASGAAQAINQKPRVSVKLAERMAHKEKTVLAPGIRMKVEVKGNAPSVGMGIVKADALVGNRVNTPKGRAPGGTTEIR